MNKARSGACESFAHGGRCWLKDEVLLEGVIGLERLELCSRVGRGEGGECKRQSWGWGDAPEPTEMPGGCGCPSCNSSV